MELMTIVLGLVVLVAGVAVVEVVVRRSDVGAGLVLALFLVEEAAVVELGISGGPVYVSPNDVLFAILATGAVARLLRTERWSTAQRLLAVLGILVMWAIAQGTDLYGLPAAVNESRKYLRFVAAALYFATMEPRQDLLERIGRLWVWVAIVLCALTVVRWGANAAGLTGGLFGEGGSMRVLPSASSLVIGQAAMLGVPALRDQADGLRKYLSPVMLVFVVLLQHRTVWAVVAVGMLYLLVREKALTPRVFATMGAGLVVFLALSFTLLDEGAEPIADQLSDSATSLNTFEWRVAGWRSLLEDSGPDGVAETLTGQPPGGGWERRFDGLVVDVSPHNFYIEVYLRLGLLGVTGLLALYAYALTGGRRRETRSNDRADLLPPRILRTLVAVQLLYYVTYTPDLLQAMLLGLGCAFATSPRSRHLEDSGQLRAEAAW